MREGVEGMVPMIGTGATLAHATEGEVGVGGVNESIIDTAAAEA